MRLESLLAATGGRLINTPAITRFDNVTLKLSKVERGSLYLPRTPEEIPQAIEKGAYGIATDFIPQLCDEEVAWILWPSRQNALIGLLRLWLVENPRKIIKTSPPTLAFIAQLSNRRSCAVIDGNEEQMSEALLSSTPDQSLFCAASDFLDRIGAKLTQTSPQPIDTKLLRSDSFTTSWLIEERYYEQIPVVECLKHFFIEALGLLRAERCSYEISVLKHTANFLPLYFDRWGIERDPSEGDRVIILTKEAQGACLHHFDTLRWAKRTLFIPINIKIDCDIKALTIPYDKKTDLGPHIMHQLKTPGFTMIIGIDKDILIDLMQSHGLGHIPYRTKGLF